MIKIYECAICKRFVQRKIKGQERFRGTRKDVRKHLVEDHRIRGRKNPGGMSTGDFGKSNITAETLSREFK